MFIAILKYGDFDVAYTECIMVSDKKYSRKNLLTEFANEGSITPNAKIDPKIMLGSIEYSNDGQLRISAEGISNIHEYDTAPDLFIKFLQKKGFTKLPTESIRFSD